MEATRAGVGAQDRRGPGTSTAVETDRMRVRARLLQLSREGVSPGNENGRGADPPFSAVRDELDEHGTVRPGVGAAVIAAGQERCEGAS